MIDRRDPHPKRRMLLAAAAAVVVIAGLGLVVTLSLGGDDAGGSGPEAHPFERQDEAARHPSARDPEDPAGRYPVALVKRRTVLYQKPRGKRKVTIAARTRWGSPRKLSVVRRRGGWLAVLVPELENGEVGWIEASNVDDLTAVDWSVNVDISRRRVVVKRGSKTLRTVTVGVGRPDHPTPTGRFAVTDKLRVTDPGSPYGCCVLALTGHQTKLPVGWPGGDRLAVHATSDLSGLGNEVSTGCLRSAPEDARWMIRRVPLGTPVFIRA